MAVVMTTDRDTNTAPAPKVGSRRFLFANWEGGGNTPPVVSVVRRLVGRGHAVRVISDPCQRREFEAAGASFASWTRAPHRLDTSRESDPLRDWEGGTPPEMLGRLRDRLLVGPALAYAQDVMAELQRFPADVVVTSEMLLGAMLGAEASGVPCVSLAANVYLFERPGVPPFGPGFLPATNTLHRLRDWMVRKIAMRAFGKGTAAFNEARRALGLGPVRHPFEQVSRLSRQIVLTSAAFDFPSTVPSPTIVYAGPELAEPGWAAPWRSPWDPADRRPLVLVGFSTTFQNQVDALTRVVNALGGLDVRAVVTTGPAIDVASIPHAANVHVCASAPHAELMREAAAVVTHAGHGTVIRALAAGVPLVCMPMGRDQNDNAARVVYRGLGVRVDPKADADAIRKAVQQVLTDAGYRQRARALGVRIADECRHPRAVELLEAVALQQA